MPENPGEDNLSVKRDKGAGAGGCDILAMKPEPSSGQTMVHSPRIKDRFFGRYTLFLCLNRTFGELCNILSKIHHQ